MSKYTTLSKHHITIKRSLLYRRLIFVQKYKYLFSLEIISQCMYFYSYLVTTEISSDCISNPLFSTPSLSLRLSFCFLLPLK